MASLASFSRRGPQCLRCMRRTLNGLNNMWLSSTGQQIRTKKKLAKATTIKVRLLEDVPRYGRKGTIISIPPGQMRNSFYLKEKAEYTTKAQLRETGLRDSDMHRDSTFGISTQQFVQDSELAAEPAAVPVPLPIRTTPRAVEVDLIKPEHAMKIVSNLIPPNIDFYRVPIPPASPSSPKQSPSIPATSAISVAVPEAGRGKEVPDFGIYGSVTAADIAETLKAILAADREGSRVVLTQEDIKFVVQGEENDRVKQLGIFEIDVKVKGATDAARRTITIKAHGKE